MSLKTAKVLEKRELTHDVFELDFEKTFDFEIGQFITIKINDQAPPCFRGYSLASNPSNQETFTLCIKAIPGGRGSNWLHSLEPGDQIEFIGPVGSFTFKTSSEKTVFFIATGTGIAPFKASLENLLLTNKSTQQFHLLFGVRHKEDIIYKELFEDLAKHHDNFTFDITLSRSDDSWEGNNGRVTDILKSLDTTNSEAYICGLTPMIDSVCNILKEKGLTEEEIHFEKYD